MRLALTGLITAAALAAAAQSSSAQVAFFNERFCAGGGDASIPDCSFYTWEQCIASARGLGLWCTTNPWWHGDRRPADDVRKKRGRDR